MEYITEGIREKWTNIDLLNKVSIRKFLRWLYANKKSIVLQRKDRKKNRSMEGIRHAIVFKYVIH